jgi:hypothetical protein
MVIRKPVVSVVYRLTEKWNRYVYNSRRFLCFTDRASRYICVIKTNLMHYLSSVYSVNQPHTTTNTELAASCVVSDCCFGLIEFHFHVLVSVYSFCSLNVAKFYTIIIPTKCTLFYYWKHKILQSVLFCLVFLPLHISTRVGHLQRAQCQCLAKVIIDYNLLKLR